MFIADVIPGLGGSTRLRATPPIRAASELHDPTLFVIPGEGSSSRDEFLNRALRFIPTAGARIEGQNTYAPIIPTLRGLVGRCTLAGVLVALVAFVLVALDQAEERRTQQAPLAVIGVPPSMLVRVSMVQAAVVTCLVMLLGSVVGWQACAAYIAIGQSGASAFMLRVPVSFVMAIVALQAAAVLITSRVQRRRTDDVASDLRIT